jgi:hypothetical protein
MDPNLLEIGSSTSLEEALAEPAKALKRRRPATSLEQFETGSRCCSR